MLPDELMANVVVPGIKTTPFVEVTDKVMVSNGALVEDQRPVRPMPKFPDATVKVLETELADKETVGDAPRLVD